MKIQIGNATMCKGEALSVLKDMDDGSVDAVLTDPPYSSGGLTVGQRQQAPSKKYQSSDALKKFADFPGDNRDQRSFITWATLWLAEAYRVAKPGAPLMMFTDWRQLPAMTDALQAGGWLWRNIVVWDKPTARPAKGEFKRQCEFVLIGSKGKLAPATERCLPGVFRHSIVSGGKRQHLTEKPVPLLRDLLQISPEGCTILDPFAGSATTAQACLETGRKFIGVELSEVYFDVACARLNTLANWTI
ncbi:DNA-methyltransferase [Pseudodesulfovibrio indicus]|uniref:Methyltransferase n=1 Tax=Pseudodesulfovibrio indicus TaxID=1716143 RepID=A0A126QM03_9BACT|nr:site-specific DNA-methyltransferase [Pseudodesulfovibrio indicus]AMK10839.1 DNA methylase [Pseudodesulfovibrio indicus]TDT91833.1 site-specific DNA-methyltransferase (adenine-specific) [Pseudodesulfovibrio indicus]